MSSRKRRKLIKEKIKDMGEMTLEEAMKINPNIPKDLDMMDLVDYKEYLKETKTDWWEKMKDDSEKTSDEEQIHILFVDNTFFFIRTKNRYTKDKNV